MLTACLAFSPSCGDLACNGFHWRDQNCCLADDCTLMEPIPSLLPSFSQVLRNTDLLAFGFSPTSGSLGTVLSTILEQDVSSWTYVNMDELRESQIIKIIARTVLKHISYLTR